MLAFLLQVDQWIQTGRFYVFAGFMMAVWALWLLRVVLAAQYRPWRMPYQTTTSVIIPVVDEPEDLFRDVLSRIIDQRPTEIIVVINGPRNRSLERICADLGARWAWTDQPGKRNALKVGVGMSHGEIAVLVDSDTIWTAGTLVELVKPFRHPRVGGVTTKQRILNPTRSRLTRWADWLESVRNEYSMPAMSVLGTVGCLPGRTIAFRRKILVQCMNLFLTEQFLGVLLEVGDDRTLTNYTLKAGYLTVYQSTSLVYTDAPAKLPKLLRQQFRWARSSQYNTLRMLPWMLRNAPILAIFYTADIVVPFVLVGSYLSWVFSVVAGTTSTLYGDLPLPHAWWASVVFIVGLSMLMTTMSLAIRFGRHFAYSPGDMVHLPTFMIINTLLLMPIRVLGFFRMAHNAEWGTRSSGFAGERVRNPQFVIPYLLGTVMILGSVLINVKT